MISDLVHEIDTIISFQRRLETDQLIECHPETVDVTARAKSIESACCLFGTHESGRAYDATDDVTWIGEVGQSAFEELNVLEPGQLDASHVAADPAAVLELLGPPPAGERA